MIAISGCTPVPQAPPQCVYGEALAATSHMAYRKLPPDGVRALVDAVNGADTMVASPGAYAVHLLLDDGYTVAATATFTVTAP